MFETESSEHAATVFHKTDLREGVQRRDLVLHADNGAPMKGPAMLATLRALACCRRSADRVSATTTPTSGLCSRPWSIAPDFPSKTFASLDAARESVGIFVQW